MAIVMNADLVKETSTTTGTGAYTLLGAASGFRAFSAGVTLNAYCICSVRMGSQFEMGLYQRTGASTLARTIVWRSSNANNAVDWGPGTKTITLTGGSFNMVPGRHNAGGGTAAPSDVTDTAEDGYEFMSVWAAHDGIGESGFSPLFMRGAPTGSTEGPWHRISFTRQIGWLNKRSDDLPSAGGVVLGDYFAVHTVADNRFNVVAMGDGAHALWGYTRAFGLGWSWNDNPGGHQMVEVGLVEQTTDNTPTALYGSMGYPALEPDSAVHFDMIVVARCNADNDVASWRVQALLKRNGSGDPTIVGSPTITSLFADAGAATWDVDVAVDTTNDAIEVQVTGANSKTIRWSCYGTATQVAFT